MLKLAFVFLLVLSSATSFADSYLVSVTEGKHEDDRIFSIYRERSEPDIIYSLETNCRPKGKDLECFDIKKKKATYPKQGARIFTKAMERDYVFEGKMSLDDWYDPTRTPDDKRTPQERAYDRNMKKAWGSDTQGSISRPLPILNPSQQLPATLQNERKEAMCRAALRQAMEYYYLAPQAFTKKPTAETWQQEYENCLKRAE